MNVKKYLSFAIALFILLSGFSIFGNDKNYIQWWELNHGDYLNTEGKDDFRAKWAYKVFEKVKNTADKVAHRPPRLFIINTRGEPYALALPDGGIIINPNTLNICYANVKPEKGDQRLAFILGHELAHLANDDFMHHEAFLVLQQYGIEKVDEEIAKHFKLSKPEKANEFKLKELMADKKGLLCAAMAGYDVSGLFRESDNFFSLWAEQVGIKDFYEADHPSPDARLNFIRANLKSIVREVELFRAGVLLYQKGSYFDAVGVFSEFLKTYPAREVLNNMGACYFSIALLYLHQNYPDVYYRFRISTTLDYTTSAEPLALRSVLNHLKDEIFMKYIEKAENSFRLSVQRDPTNCISRLNLSAALILKGKYALAQGECNYILEKKTNNVRALNNKAIAFYYYGKKEDMDTVQKAINYLEKAHQNNPDDFEVLYNLASLKTKRTRMVGAVQNWEEYLKIAPRDNFFKHVCKKLKNKCPPDKGNYREIPVLKQYINIRLGDNLLGVKRKLKKAKFYDYEYGNEGMNRKKGYDSFSLLDLRVIVTDNLRILFLGNEAELIELKLKTGKNVREMLAKYGQPEKVVRHSTGNFYVYNKKGFSFKEVDGKVRAFIWFGKEL
ncbi:MAG: M48 family metalloprotease [Candidatus Aminicenantes bacterium]|nr:M48 family metalloprotease [Candidatus Aminicenantes bacterium]